MSNLASTLTRRRQAMAAWPARAALLTITALLFAGFPAAAPGRAAEVPPVGDFVIQTSGAGAGLGIGDWYSSTDPGGGSGQHYVEITVPCGWPSARPIYVDLFSPEMNRVAAALGGSEELRGNHDSSEFELYGPNASVGPGWASPAAGTGVPGTRTVYQPGAAGVAEAWVRFATLDPVTCGRYVLRSAVLSGDPLNPAGEGNDDNGWRIRAGSDSDQDPTTAPPAGYDDADGIPGTNDEIVLGVAQTTYQQDTSPTACLTLYEYVAPGQPSVTFNNFDMDGNTSVRYYAPSDAIGIAGTVSNSTGWNSPAAPARLSRSGDTIVSPAQGWWRIVSCISRNNQFIQEGTASHDAYFTQPPTPALSVTKDDGTATAVAGSPLTYAIILSNTAAGPTAGAALNIRATDALPAQTTFSSCSIQAPATGTCTEAAGIVTATLDGWLNAGATATVDLTVDVDPDATGTLANDVDVTYADGLGNPYPMESASDLDGIEAPTPTPDATPTPTPDATPTPTPDATPTPTPDATPTPTPTPTPDASVDPAMSPSLSPSSTSRPTLTATSTPAGGAVSQATITPPPTASDPAANADPAPPTTTAAIIATLLLASVVALASLRRRSRARRRSSARLLV